MLGTSFSQGSSVVIVLCFAYISEMMSREFLCHFEEMKCMIIPICTEFKYLPISFVSAMHALMVILQRPFHAHTHHAPIHTYFLSPVSTTCDIYLIVFCLHSSPFIPVPPCIFSNPYLILSYTRHTRFFLYFLPYFMPIQQTQISAAMRIR